MGCDIHLHQEVKMDGEWRHYGHPAIHRSYELFGLMAGVRGSATPVAEAKGVPNDMTYLTQFSYDQWIEYNHHASWLGAEEIKEVIERFCTKDIWEAGDWFGYLFGSSWVGYIKYSKDLPEKLEDIRWVFWFDN